MNIIRYIAQLHLNDLFHGDIKPENIMSLNHIITSDAGSLLFMKSEKLDDEIYIVDTFTQSYSSSEHVKAVKGSLPRSKRKLF